MSSIIMRLLGPRTFVRIASLIKTTLVFIKDAFVNIGKVLVSTLRFLTQLVIVPAQFATKWVFKPLYNSICAPGSGCLYVCCQTCDKTFLRCRECCHPYEKL